jgi:hypothetical protein
LIKPFSMAMAAGPAICALMVIGAAQAAASTPTPVHAARLAVNPDKPICRSQPIPGSRLGGKTICLTRAQWDQMGQDARDVLRDMSSRQGVANATDGMAGGMTGGMMGSH